MLQSQIIKKNSSSLSFFFSIHLNYIAGRCKFSYKVAYIFNIIFSITMHFLWSMFTTTGLLAVFSSLSPSLSLSLSLFSSSSSSFSHSFVRPFLFLSFSLSIYNKYTIPEVDSVLYYIMTVVKFAEMYLLMTRVQVSIRNVMYDLLFQS